MCWRGEGVSRWFVGDVEGQGSMCLRVRVRVSVCLGVTSAAAAPRVEREEETHLFFLGFEGNLGNEGALVGEDEYRH